jgi:hypothetical protein
MKYHYLSLSKSFKNIAYALLAVLALLVIQTATIFITNDIFIIKVCAFLIAPIILMCFIIIVVIFWSVGNLFMNFAIENSHTEKDMNKKNSTLNQEEGDVNDPEILNGLINKLKKQD